MSGTPTIGAAAGRAELYRIPQTNRSWISRSIRIHRIDGDRHIRDIRAAVVGDRHRIRSCSKRVNRNDGPALPRTPGVSAPTGCAELYRISRTNRGRIGRSRSIYLIDRNRNHAGGRATAIRHSNRIIGGGGW